MNLHIVVLFRIKENHLMEAVELFQKLVYATRKESGCIQYDLIEDSVNKGTFFLIELWESKEHHHIHDSVEHLVDFRKNISSILEESTQVYKGFKIY